MPVTLPPALLESLRKAPGFDEAAFIALHASPALLTSVRFHTQKWPAPFQVPEAWTINHPTIHIQPVPWCSSGLYLSERPSFTTDPLLHAGAYYVQEASSMFIEWALRQTVDLLQPLIVLDACAAPGGKSTLIQSLISNQSVLVSNEVIKTRASILSENISKWGASNVVVTNNDPRDFQRLGPFFDVMVVDAPCSGSGLFRKDAAAVEEWSEENVQLCSQRQQRILADLLPALKPGGTLLYSTCSYSIEEDESIADWLIEQGLESLPISINPEWGIVQTQSPLHQAHGYRFYPDRVRGEGFFLSVFRKPSGDPGRPSVFKPIKPNARALEVVAPYLTNDHNIVLVEQDTVMLAMPPETVQVLVMLKKQLYIRKAGVTLGQIIREELIPDHELAVSGLLRKEQPSIAVEWGTALNYLRRKDIQLEGSRKGWTILTFEGLPLGWVKILPGRVNNYYPKDWRILHQ